MFNWFKTKILAETCVKGRIVQSIPHLIKVSIYVLGMFIGHINNIQWLFWVGSALMVLVMVWAGFGRFAACSIINEHYNNDKEAFREIERKIEG